MISKSSKTKLKSALFEDQKGPTTDGGSSVVGLQTRDINTTLFDAIGCTLSANAITPPKGTYLIEANAPARNVGGHRLSLHDGTSIIAEGPVNYMATAENVSTVATLRAKIIADGVKAYSLSHYTSSARSSIGLGSYVTGATNSIYAQLKITEIN